MEIKTENRNWKKRGPSDLSSLIELANHEAMKRAPTMEARMWSV